MPVSLERLAAQPGIVLRDGLTSMSGAALARDAAAERSWLRRQGRRFGLLAENGCGWAVTDLALLGDRTPLVPLPSSFTAAQLLHTLDDAGIDAVLSDTPARILELEPGFTVRAVSPRTGLALLVRRLPCPPPLPAGTARITYTSGSTGTPKGVCLRAATLAAAVSSLVAALGAEARRPHLALLPLSTLLENVAGLYLSLACGGCCELRPLAALGMREDGPDAMALCRAVGSFAPATLILVPELLRLLVGATVSGWRPPASLRFVAVGGAVVAPDLLMQAAAAGLPVYEGYGLSECASVLSLNLPGANRPGSVGRPLPHAQVRIGADGEILVRGAVHAGYLGGPPADGGWATGDLGHLDEDGYLYVHGRRRNLLITAMGRNISPEWVERELVSESGIASAIVAGEARPFLTALICPAGPGANVDAAVAHANARLPAYARVRRHAVLPAPFTRENGQLTANGRPRRDVILERHAPLIERLYCAGSDTPATRLEAQHEFL